MSSLKNKAYLITGASRGIGKAIALKLAAQGATIVVVGKSVKEDERLGGTIYSAAEDIEKAGGKALAIPCDIREEEQIASAISKVAQNIGVLHGLVNNASAIYLQNTTHTPAKRFDLMHDINVRGTFLTTAHAIPLLQEAHGAHIITLSPPIDLHPKWLSPFAAYTVSKYTMSMYTLAWGTELQDKNISATSLWPATTIATAAVKNLLGGDELIARSRTTDIVADAALAIIEAGNKYNGKCVTDEEVLRNNGVSNFDHYAVDSSKPLQKDLFL